MLAGVAGGLADYLGWGRRKVRLGFVIFGLFGALIVYGQRTGSNALSRQVWTWVGFIVVIGLVLPGIDNWAHLGGFAGGYGFASVFDPLKPERAEHLIGALVGLALSLLAVVVSLLHFFA